MPSPPRPTFKPKRSSTTTPQVGNDDLRRISSSDRVDRAGTDSQQFHRTHSRQHIVGHRGQQGRVPSVGKNLHRLVKLANSESGPSGKHHYRSRSHDPSVQPLRDLISARPSALSLKRTSTDTTVVDEPEEEKEDEKEEEEEEEMSKEALRKTSVAPRNKRTDSSNKVKQSKAAKFDFETEDAEAGWTETSASQSPADSRTATKHHSPVASHANIASHARGVEPAQLETELSSQQARNEKERSNQNSTMSSGLLPRVPTFNAEPQLTNISVIRPPTMQQSGSTISMGTTIVTPSVDSVSKFIGSSSTSNGQLNLSRGSSKEGLLLRKNVSAEQQRSRTNNTAPAQENHTPSPGDNRNQNGLSSNYAQPQIPSRTQQKLWLQRARSNIEPQQIPPSALTGVTSMRSPGLNRVASHTIGGLGAGYGDTVDPRLQKEIERTAREYLITFRYRKELPPSLQQTTPKRSSRQNPTNSESLQTPKYGVNDSRHKRNSSHGEQETRTLKSKSTLEELGSENVDPPSFLSGSDSTYGTVDRVLQRFWERVEINGSD